MDLSKTFMSKTQSTATLVIRGLRDPEFRQKLLSPATGARPSGSGDGGASTKRKESIKRKAESRGKARES